MNRRNFILALFQTITIPKAGYQRASIEAKLMELLRQDIKDAHLDHVDWTVRKEIAKLATELVRTY